MRLEDVQLAIRQRSLIECLDLTFLFCGRHWFGLLGSASVGIVPVAAFNWWIADIREMHPYSAALLLLMELPWTTMFITLYLGQVTFSKKLSFRRMLVDVLQAVPGLLAFQVLVRGVCLAVVVLAPFVFVGMFYLNEIILLEKPQVARIWHRRVAMNSRILDRIITIRIIDFFVLCGGTFALRELFLAISSIWEDRSNEMWLIMVGEGFVPEMLDWQTYCAFWIVVVFLTVFRFMSYLDGRIRREGWDVELKLRAQASMFQQHEAVT